MCEVNEQLPESLAYKFCYC